MKSEIEKPTAQTPKSGDLAIIQEEGGSLHIYVGNINMDHQKLYRIDSVEWAGKELQIVARQRTKIKIDEKLTQHEGFVEFKGEKLGMREFLFKCALSPEKFIQKYFKHTFFMKLFGKPPIEFEYVLLEDQRGHWDSPKKITLKEELWPTHTFIANNYILTHF